MQPTPPGAHDEVVPFVEDPRTAPVPVLDTAVASHEEHLAAHPDCPIRWLRQGLAGHLLVERGERTGSREDMARGIGLLRKATADPAAEQAPGLLGTFLYNLGTFLTRTGFSASFDALREGIDAYRRAFPLLSGTERRACVSNLLPELLKAAARADRPELRLEARELALEFLDEAPSDPRMENSVWNTLLDCLSEEPAPAHLCLSLLPEAEALARRAAPDELRAVRLDRLTRLLRTAWRTTGDPDRLTRAIAAGRQAVSLCPDRGTVAANLALVLSDAGILHNDPELLEEAARFGRKALEHTPPDTSDHLSMRGDLGAVLFRLSEHRNQEENLRAALDHTAAVVEHAGRTGNFGLLRTFLPNLATVRLRLGTVTGDQNLLTDALDTYRETLALPLTPAHRAKVLGNYGGVQGELALRTDRPGPQLRQACEAMAEALALYPDDDPELGPFLDQYALTALRLLLHDGTAATRNTVIDAWERILTRALSHSLHETAALCREFLTATYWRRYDHGTGLRDVDKAIEHGEHVLRHPPPDPQRLQQSAYFVAEAYRARASVTGNPADFERAIDLVAEMLQRPDLDDSKRQSFLVLQSANHYDRFHAFSTPSDLDEALSCARKAVAVPGPADPESAALAQLAACLTQRPQLGGPLEDLDRAVEIYRAAWTSIRARLGDPTEENAGSGGYGDTEIGVAHNLASALAQRYHHHEIPADLDEAVDTMTAVLRLTPENHHKRPERLTTAANMIHHRWFRNRSADDLATCLAQAEEAVATAAPGSFAHHHALAALVGIHGDVLDEHEDGAGDTQDGENARISREELLNRHQDSRDRAIELGLRTAESEEDLPLRSWVLVAHNTAAALLRRWQAAGNRDDLEKSISLGRRILDRAGLERSPVTALLLGSALIHHARNHGDGNDGHAGAEARTEAAAVLRALSACAAAPARMRFTAARWWATVTGRPDEETLAACRRLMELLPLVAWVGAPRTVREAALADQAGLVSMAAQAALDAERPTDAVEFLELGRGVLWSQRLDLRTDLAEIEEVAPDLAARLAAVRQALDASAAFDEGPGGSSPVGETAELAPPEPMDPDWATALRQAREMAMAGDKDRLFDFLAPLTTADDPRVAAYAEFGRALVLLERGDRDGAREALTRAAGHGSGVAPAAADALGDLLAADGDFAAARAAYEQARALGDPAEAREAAAKLRRLEELETATVRLDPQLARLLVQGDPSRLIAAGLQLMLEGRHLQALSFLERGLPRLPAEEQPLLAPLLAQARQRTGDHPGARTAWELALRAANPGAVAVAALSFGDFLVCEYTLDEARTAYTRALDTPATADEARARLEAIAPAPSSAPFLEPDFDYGRWVAHREPRESALAALTPALEAGDRNPRTHYYLTEVTDYSQDPDAQRERNHLHRVLALATEDDAPLVLLCRARLRCMLGDRQGGHLLLEDAYQAAVAAGDSELAVLAAVKQAALLSRAGDVEAAHAAYQRAIRTGHPHHSFAAAFDLARMLSEAGREEEARSAYRHVMAGGHPVQGGMSAVNLGMSLLRSGDVPGAVEAFEWAADGAWQDAADRARALLAKLSSRKEGPETSREEEQETSREEGGEVSREEGGTREAEEAG